VTIETHDPAAAAQRMRDRAGQTDPANLPHSCRCGTRWTGSTTSHCGTCHTTFNGVRTFDIHRRGGTCKPPSDVGMSVVPGRSYECWGYPGEVTE
jgi:hypothetical protein